MLMKTVFFFKANFAMAILPHRHIPKFSRCPRSAFQSVQVLAPQTGIFQEYNSFSFFRKIKVNQSHYRPEVPRGFQEVKVPRLRDDGPEWW